MNATQQLLARHAGVWEGEYTHIAPGDRSVQDQHTWRIRIDSPVSDTVAYRQTSHYFWPDGRTQQLMYEGRAEGDRVVIDTGRIRGECWSIEDDTLYLWFGFTAEPTGRVTEMIQLSRDGNHRARTWHWFRDEALWRITLVREQRVSLDPADFDRLNGPPSLR